MFGRELTEKTLYGLFNPESLGDEDEGKINLNQLIKEQLQEAFEGKGESRTDDYTVELLRTVAWMHRHGVREYMGGYLKDRKARERAWNQLMEKIRKGEIKPSEISLKQLIENFQEMVIESLTKDGWMNLKVRRPHLQPNLYFSYPEFTMKSERAIARKVLEEAFINLERYGFGSHETSQTGFGLQPSGMLREFDEHRDTYDMLDIQETLISAALRDPENVELRDEDLKARMTMHRAKSSNVIAVDMSYSMEGIKFKGGLMAALALKELLRQEYREDKLDVVAFNHKPIILKPGEILRLKPFGYTDIGLALDLAAQILVKEDTNRNIFLITDSEPTVSCYSNQTPIGSSLRAAYQLGRFDINLNILMLDRRAGLRVLCEKMAKLNGDATVTYINNPLNLKEFVIKSFIAHKRSL